MFRRAIRLRRVLGCMPRIPAAPRGPAIRPRVRCSTRTICRRSISARDRRSLSSLAQASGPATALLVSPVRAGQDASARTTQRLITFAILSTLLGQAWPAHDALKADLSDEAEVL